MATIKVNSNVLSRPVKSGSTTSTMTAKPTMVDYNDNSQYQSSANELPNLALQRAGKILRRRRVTDLNVGDFGCSHGLNSMQSIRQLLTGYLAKPVTEPLAIQVYLNDLPENDFSKVLSCLSDSTLSYETHERVIAGGDMVRVVSLLSGRSFYNQCFPDAHLNLGFSFNALHWLSYPVTLGKSIVLKGPKVTQTEARAVAQHAQNQLAAFLDHRARELQVGGQLILTILHEAPTLADFDRLWHCYLGSINHPLIPCRAVPAYPRATTELMANLSHMHHRFKLIHHNPSILGKVGFDYATLRAATYTSMLAAVTGHLGDHPATTHLLEGFYTFLAARWSPDPPKFHLVVLERI